MSDDSGNRRGFEQTLRAIAQELSQKVDQVSQTDLDQVARATGIDPERARQWTDEAGRWLKDQADQFAAGEPFGNPFGAPGRPGGDERPASGEPAGASADAPADDPLRAAGPHPLDVPTDEQGLALAALDSGRWTVEPGTSALTARGDGAGPSDALGLVRELRVRDWLDLQGEVTLAGRHALARWLETSER